MIIRLKLFWLKVQVWRLREKLMILRLKRVWLNLQLWWWSRGMETVDVNNEEPLLRAALQGLHEVEIDPNYTRAPATLEELGAIVQKNLQDLHEISLREEFETEFNTETDGDDRVSVMVSVNIPSNFDRALYDTYAYEFEKSMGRLMAKGLELGKNFKQDDLSIGAFTIEATLFLRGVNVNDNDADSESNGFPFNSSTPLDGSDLLGDDPDVESGSKRPYWLSETLKYKPKKRRVADEELYSSKYPDRGDAE